MVRLRQDVLMKCKCCKADVSVSDLWKRSGLLLHIPTHALARLDGRLVVVCLKNRKLT